MRHRRPRGLDEHPRQAAACAEAPRDGEAAELCGLLAGLHGPHQGRDLQSRSHVLGRTEFEHHLGHQFFGAGAAALRRWRHPASGVHMGRLLCGGCSHAAASGNHAWGWSPSMASQKAGLCYRRAALRLEGSRLPSRVDAALREVGVDIWRCLSKRLGADVGTEPPIRANLLQERITRGLRLAGDWWRCLGLDHHEFAVWSGNARMPLAHPGRGDSPACPSWTERCSLRQQPGPCQGLFGHRGER
mmetsp:Transcript_83130/g.267957  ORF Transcript_83130/g.267957 Transcript_83130/m.267957 type:complete len:245 (+) Transcript_83130:2536-3270(+)